MTPEERELSGARFSQLVNDSTHSKTHIAAALRISPPYLSFIFSDCSMVPYSAIERMVEVMERCDEGEMTLDEYIGKFKLFSDTVQKEIKAKENKEQYPGPASPNDKSADDFKEKAARELNRIEKIEKDKPVEVTITIKIVANRQGAEVKLS